MFYENSKKFSEEPLTPDSNGDHQWSIKRPHQFKKALRLIQKRLGEQ
jgi:hypothetical protein